MMHCRSLHNTLQPGRAHRQTRRTGGTRGACDPRPAATDLAAAEPSLALLKFALIASLRDLDTSAHMLRVGQLSGLIALELTGDRLYAERVCRAAPFHDIGKICIDDAILKKPGPLDADEWTQMRRHPELGGQLMHVPGNPLFAIAEEIARGHHEKFDGSGYPAGLAGEAIPLSARIVAVADYFDALTMDRCYRAAMPVAQVLAMMRALSGRHFDPRALAVLEACIVRVRELNAEVDALAAAREGQELDESVFAPLF